MDGPVTSVEANLTLAHTHTNLSFSILVKRLHEVAFFFFPFLFRRRWINPHVSVVCPQAFSKLEQLPILIHEVIGGDARGGLSGLKVLTQPFKLKLQRLDTETDPSLKDYGENVVMIEPLASIQAIENFLLPKVMDQAQQRWAPSLLSFSCFHTELKDIFLSWQTIDLAPKRSKRPRTKKHSSSKVGIFFPLRDLNRHGHGALQNRCSGNADQAPVPEMTLRCRTSPWPAKVWLLGAFCHLFVVSHR